MATGARLEVGALGSLDFAVEMRGAQWDRPGGSHKEKEASCGCVESARAFPTKIHRASKNRKQISDPTRIIHQN